MMPRRTSRRAAAGRGPQSRRVAIGASICLLAAALRAQTPPATQHVPPTTDPVVERALADLQSGDWILKWEAMVVLSQRRSPQAVGPLKQILAGPGSDWVRARALAALARIVGAECLARALALSAHTSAALRAGAVEALGIIGSGRGSASRPAGDELSPEARAVAARLADADPAVRAAALTAWARIRRDKAWDVLDKHVRGQDVHLRRAAIAALAYVGTDASRDKLLGLLADSDHTTRIAAAAALKIAGDPRVAAGLVAHAAVERYSLVRDACLDALRAFDPADVDAPLMDALRGDDAARARVALELFRTRPAARAAELAANRLDWLAEKDYQALIPALELLSRVDADGYEKLLRRHASHASTSVRRAAVHALARCRKTNRFVLFKDLLVDRDHGVRSEAFSAVRREGREPAGGVLSYLGQALASSDRLINWPAITLLRDRLTPAEFPQALAALDRFLAGSDEKARQFAAAALANIADPDSAAAIAEAQGFLARWHVIGPFPNDAENAGFEAVYPPEKEIRLDRKYRGPDAEELAWQVLDVPRADGTVDLALLVWGEQPAQVAYATCTLDAPAARDVPMAISTEDHLRLWLNGREIVRLGPGTSKRVKAAMQAGTNVLMVKTAKLKAEDKNPSWAFGIRLEDDQRRRSDLLKPREPK